MKLPASKDFNTILPQQVAVLDCNQNLQNLKSMLSQRSELYQGKIRKSNGSNMRNYYQKAKVKKSEVYHLVQRYLICPNQETGNTHKFRKPWGA
jgi:hypothetical protein